MQLLKDITLDFVLTNSHWQLVKLLSFTIEMGQDIEWEKILKNMTISLTTEGSQMNPWKRSKLIWMEVMNGNNHEMLLDP